jgi:uroporphyrinogen decarboxylase
LTPRDRFLTALDGGQVKGRVPHFELVFFLTMEAFGRVHPSHRSYHQWLQMTEHERALHRADLADLHVATAERYEHDAIFLHPNPSDEDEVLRQLDAVRAREQTPHCTILHGDATIGIPDGDGMARLAYRLIDDPAGLQAESDRNVDRRLTTARRFAAHGGLDGWALCSDYCFNTGPFLSPDQFAEFVHPYLKRLIAGYREMGFHTIKHTDGNIMPIIELLVDANPHALHSLDPQGGVDIAEVKRLYGDRICLIGNVNCGLMQTGTDAEVIASARYALEHGMPGGGYIFSTSNCVFTGLDLRRYELILDVWRRYGNYA